MLLKCEGFNLSNNKIRETVLFSVLNVNVLPQSAVYVNVIPLILNEKILRTFI